MNKYNLSDYIGSRYGSLTITKSLPSEKYRKYVLVKCNCGNVKRMAFDKLIYGRNKTCGCADGDRGKKIRTHGLRKHPLYTVWNNMKCRCKYESSVGYENYGGRGVRVCDEWENSFINFYNWAIKNGWERGLDIDKDIIGDGMIYSPQTCCFVTGKRNNNATRKNRYLEYNGEIMSMSEMSEKHNVNYYLLRKRLHMGWDVKSAIETPSRKLNKINQQPPVMA